MKRIVISFLLLTFTLMAQQTTNISGIVQGEDGKPLPFVNVYIKGSLEGAMTGEDGAFSFNASIVDDAIVVASCVGYRTDERTIDLSSSSSPLFIVLESKSVELKEAVISASSYGTEEESGIVIKSLDVLTTPGGAADVYQSLKTMPGITPVSESAELYVRGGDPIETVTIINQTPLHHPYTLESSYGGIFSNILTPAIESIFFSSGGFSAKYGNALSGVLEISTRNEPSVGSATLGLSMAASSVEAAIPVESGKHGLRFYGQHSYTQPLMWLNGDLDRFTATPVSSNFTGSYTWKYSKTGRLKLFGMAAADNQGVEVERAEFSGAFDGDSGTRLVTLQHREIPAEGLLIKSALAFSLYTNNWLLGALDLETEDRLYSLRTDLEYISLPDINLLFGGEINSRREWYTGSVPDNDYNMQPGAPVIVLDNGVEYMHYAAYGELQFTSLPFADDASLIAGVRTDNFPQFNTGWIDPRATLRYQLSDASALAFGWGIFHQLPDARLFSEADGNPDLGPMRAVHYILSFDRRFNENTSLRVEAYHKSYGNLPLEDAALNYTNNGDGYARGIDVILKGSLGGSLSGWLSYGYLDSKRKWMEFEEEAPSSYDITHSLSMVAAWRFHAFFELGMNYKLATGRPFTPVVGAEYLPGENVYEPVYGPDNSTRYENYKRLDLRLTYLNQLYGKYFTVVYLEMLNILNEDNLFDYSYSPDYSERKEIQSYFGRRTLVLGMQFTF